MFQFEVVEVINYFCMTGELWKFHAWIDEGEHSIEQESAVWDFDAWALQLQGPRWYFSCCLPRKQGSYSSQEGGPCNAHLNVFCSVRIVATLWCMSCPFGMLFHVFYCRSKKANWKISLRSWNRYFETCTRRYFRDGASCSIS